MHTCTMCGLKKSELSSPPEFEFRTRRRPDGDSFIEGISDWCPRCEALRFFFRSNDPEDTGEYFMNRSNQKIANYMLDATTAGWQDDMLCGSRTNRDNEEQSNPRWSTDDLREEAHNLKTEEILATVPSTLLRNKSTRNPNSSRIEDHEHRTHRTSERRSKSDVHEVHMDRMQPQLHSQVQTTCESERYQDDEDSCVSVDFDTQARIRNMQDFELLKSSQDEGQCRIVEIPDKREKQKHKGGRRSDRGERVRVTNPEPKKSCTIRRLTVKEVESDIRKIEKEELEEELAEKECLLVKWQMLRLRVEDECDLVKAELATLKQYMNISQDYTESGAESDEVVVGESEGEFELNEDNGSESRYTDSSSSVEEPQDSMGNMAVIPNADLEKVEYDQIEDAVTTESEIKEDEKNQFHQQYKPSMEASAAEHSLTPKRLLSKLRMMVSTVQRARFRGFPADPLKKMKYNTASNPSKRHDPPLAQFSTLPCSSQELINLLAIKREVLLPTVVRPLKVSRFPIFCPDAECQRMFFVSDFNDHLEHEHPSLGMERITPCRPKTFFLDTRAILLNKPKCSMIYFVKDKFFVNNTDKYPDLLPVLVMVARINAPHFFALCPGTIPRVSSTKRSPDQEIYMIWLTSMRPNDVKIVGTLSVWPTSSKPVVEYLMVQTSEVYNIRSEQKPMAIYNSNRSMTLPGNVVNRMTANGKHLLAVQLGVGKCEGSEATGAAVAMNSLTSEMSIELKPSPKLTCIPLHRRHLMVTSETSVNSKKLNIDIPDKSWSVLYFGSKKKTTASNN